MTEDDWSGVVVPPALVEEHEDDPDAAPWLEALPALIRRSADEWDLHPDGDPLHGGASMILPVRRGDGTPAMLKLQPLNEENCAEAIALRTWEPDTVVEVLADDPATGTILLERLRPTSLEAVPDHVEATAILAGLLARTSAVPAPSGIRRLADVAAGMIEDAPELLPGLADQSEQKLAWRLVDQVKEIAAEPGDRLLHWDLHYDNVLASDRQPWLVIDPKPLAGDPAFELFAALHNRWPDLVATGNLDRAVRRRFDQLTEAVGADPEPARAWTAARILQNILWDLEDEENKINPVQLQIAQILHLT